MGGPADRRSATRHCAVTRGSVHARREPYLTRAGLELPGTRRGCPRAILCHRRKFYYLCAVLDGYGRAILHWEIREQMRQDDVQTVDAPARGRGVRSVTGQAGDRERGLVGITLGSTVVRARLATLPPH